MSKQKDKDESLISLTEADFSIISAMLNTVQQFDFLCHCCNTVNNSRPLTIGMTQTEFVNLFLSEMLDFMEANDTQMINYISWLPSTNFTKLYSTVELKNFKIDTNLSTKFDVLYKKFRAIQAKALNLPVEERDSRLFDRNQALLGLMFTWIATTRGGLFEDHGKYLRLTLKPQCGFNHNQILDFNITSIVIVNNSLESVSKMEFVLHFWKDQEIDLTPGSRDGKQPEI